MDNRNTLRKMLGSPQYVFHPTRALRRAVRRPGGRLGPDGILTVQLPWGPELTVRSSEGNGLNIATGLVWDACVSEVLYRLLDPGETALDIGANYGYMSSILAQRAGSGGSVAAFEPHPALFPVLRASAERWRADVRLAPVHVQPFALSRMAGTARLREPIAGKPGLATLEATPGSADAWDVELRRLDDVAPDGPIGVVKIDVEGHEHAVLEGGPGVLGRVRDVVLEEEGGADAPSLALLRDRGFSVFSLGNSLWGLIVASAERPPRTGTFLGHSYLATRDLTRAAARLRSRGWTLPGL
jgi:FkbM family methyltransferase